LTPGPIPRPPALRRGYSYAREGGRGEDYRRGEGRREKYAPIPTVDRERENAPEHAHPETRREESSPARREDDLRPTPGSRRRETARARSGLVRWLRR